MAHEKQGISRVNSEDYSKDSSMISEEASVNPEDLEYAADSAMIREETTVNPEDPEYFEDSSMISKKVDVNVEELEHYKFHLKKITCKQGAR